MKIPFLTARFFASIDDPAARIETAVQDRSRRLIMGVAVDHEVQSLQCGLMMTRGHGKFLRVQQMVGDQQPLPPSITNQWQQLQQSTEVPLQTMQQFASEMADVQSQAIEIAKRHAGKYVDRILAVGLTDPGMWMEDFDGRQMTVPLSDPQRVADLTGLTTVDHFPANDLLAGGRGKPLDALPLWIAIADRSSTVAREHRMVIRCGDVCTGYLVPASDGLDAELPKLQRVTAPGERLIRCISQSRNGSFPSSNPGRPTGLNARLTSKIGDQWNEITGQRGTSREEEAVQSLANHETKLASWIIQQMDDEGGATARDVWITATIAWIAGALRQQGEAIAAKLNAANLVLHDSGTHAAAPTPPLRRAINQTWLIGSSPVAKEIQRLSDKDKLLPGIVSQTDSGIDASNVLAAEAALLGVLNIDQMQANIPWLTGAVEPRLLGRLTPGCPSNWRNLIRDMSDFRPPAMKLKDAI